MCTHNICPFNKFSPLNRFFTNFSTTFRFQCNEHVEMNTFLCSVACTWMIIIDSQFYIIDSLSLDVLLNEMLTWWLPGCYKCTSKDRNEAFFYKFDQNLCQ